MQLQYLNGVKIGNINHSRKFVPNFLKSLHYVLKREIFLYLTKESSKTGCVLPVAITADLAIYHRVTQQVVTLIVPILNSNTLMKAIPLTIEPITSDGKSGDAIVQRIVEIVLEAIRSDQIVSQSYDGAYFHNREQNKYF